MTEQSDRSNDLHLYVGGPDDQRPPEAEITYIYLCKGCNDKMVETGYPWGYHFTGTVVIDCARQCSFCYSRRPGDRLIFVES